ncbi:DUF456 domain-containing protein [uncultured Desulfovibrio sp.]|uniref:DUF456 domain-containing protein n=1 Tax=uncultured Desulfovibrio sp. TaxID=167968 RepID=UPI002610D0A0|nr:DUF456 domain-containing protein [uncultured Desulfovibrio sp.]
MEALLHALSYGVAYIFVVLLALVLLLNIPGLPANWLVLALVGIWQFVHPQPGDLDIWFWVMAVGLALLGEVLETGVQVIKGRRHGSSKTGTFAGMIGAIVGAVVFAPFLLGVGALLGALFGAWLGCLLVELMRGRPLQQSLDAAFGTMVGRFLGTVCKCGVGGAIVALTARRIWPGPPSSLPLPPPDMLPSAPPAEAGQVVIWLGHLFC